MKTLHNKIKITCLAGLSSIFFLSSCNKDLPGFDPIEIPAYNASAGNIAASIAANPNDSLFNRMLIRSGLASTLADSTKTFTLFAVDNAGMRIFVNQASLGAIPIAAPDATHSAFIANSLPAASAAGIIQYNTIGQKYLWSAIPAISPNYPLPSLIQLDPVNSPFVRMTINPAKTAGGASFVNTIPVTTTDQIASNGVIHRTFTVVAPPTRVLRDLIAAEPTLSYFRAAVLRADSAADVITPTKPTIDSTKFINYLLGYGVLNMTVLPPNDAAFQTLIFGLVYSQTLAATGSIPIATANANGAVAAGPAFLFTNNVSTALIKGIVAYHILATNSTGSFAPNIRVFNANVPTTSTFFRTLVNGSFATHPGVRATSTFSGPFAASLVFSGAGTFPPGGTAFSQPANAIKRDQNGVNGVYHIIDAVMLPQ